MRRTIAIVDDVANLGGVSSVIAATIEALVPTCDVAVLCPDGEVVEGYQAAGATWSCVDYGDRSLSGFAGRAPSPGELVELRRARRRLRSALHEVGATDVHVMAKYPRVAMAGGRRWPKFTWHVHEVLPSVLRGLPPPDQVVAVSEAAAAPLRRRRTSSSRLQVVPNPVDVERFRPCTEAERTSARTALDLGDGPVVSVIARITPLKAIEDVFAAVAGASPSVTVLVAGSPGPEARDVAYETELRAVAGELGLDVRFLGTRDDVEQILWASDLGVSASRWEGFGLGVAEALASGVPVVVTDVGGHRDIVDDDSTGLLVPSGDVPALRHAVSSLLGDERRRRAMAVRGPQVASARWRPDLFRQRIRAVHGLTPTSR